MSTPLELPTAFASAERASQQALHRQIDYFSAASLTRQLLDSVPSLLMILNGYRQIVYANQALVDLIAPGEEQRVHGQRPGEILGCIHADTTPGGCGTTEPCSTCGAVLAILAGLNGQKDARECRVTRCVDGRQESLDLLVWAAPINHGEEAFTVLAVSDISHEKRRQALERIFFHDILNVAGSIRGFAELLQSYDPADREEIFALIQVAAERTIDEIQAQKMLTAAESRDLQVRFEPLEARDFLQEMVFLYQRHEVAEGRNLVLDPTVPEILFHSDRALLGRIMGNMIKNALEACAPGQTVTVGCSAMGERIHMRVHNPGVIPRQEQWQIFQRSFSTKGAGRGLGTYSLRLLSDYLQGEVSFTSTEDGGTTFLAVYPLHLASPPAAAVPRSH